MQPGEALQKLYDEYVTVRVTDMRGVDLSRYRFDFDLTFAALLMHPNGHVYHRYGGRDVRSADHWLSDESFATLLETTLVEHERYERAKDTSLADADRRQPLRLENVPAFAARDKGECIHCHNINEFQSYQARAENRWNEDDIWVYPEPARIGLDLDREEQGRVLSVEAESPAARAGMLALDRLVQVGDVSIASASDVMEALDRVPMAGGELALRYRRGEDLVEASLALPEGWRRGTPYSFSWRPFKWALDPVPGFGGPALTVMEREKLGLDPANFAFRVQYTVTWGPRRRYGQAAGRAGLRTGDIVTAVAGKRDFRSTDHFHAWWRLTRSVGETVPIDVVREGEALTIDLKVIE